MIERVILNCLSANNEDDDDDENYGNDCLFSGQNEARTRKRRGKKKEGEEEKGTAYASRPDGRVEGRLEGQ